MTIKLFIEKKSYKLGMSVKEQNLLMGRLIQNIMGMQTPVLQILGGQQLQTMILTSPNGMEVKAGTI